MMQTHPLGQFAGQYIPNLCGSSHPSGSVLLQQTAENLVDLSNDWHKDPGINHMRKFMQEKIAKYFLALPQAYDWGKRVDYAVKSIECRLFKEAISKEDYMNQDTLAHRMHVLMKTALADAKHSHQVVQGHSSSNISMITPSSVIPKSSCTSNSTEPLVDNPLNTSSGSGTSVTDNNDHSAGVFPGPLSYGCSEGLADMNFLCKQDNILSPINKLQDASQMVPTPQRNLLKISSTNRRSGILQRLPSYYGFPNESPSVWQTFTERSMEYIVGARAASKTSLNFYGCGNLSKSLQHLDEQFQDQPMQVFEVNAIEALDCENNQKFNHLDFGHTYKKSSAELPFSLLAKMNGQVSSSTNEHLLNSHYQLQEFQQLQGQLDAPYLHFSQPFEVQPLCDPELQVQRIGSDNGKDFQPEVLEQNPHSESQTRYQHSMSQEPSMMETNARYESHQRITGQDPSQQPQFSSEEPVGRPDIASEMFVLPHSSDVALGSGNTSVGLQYLMKHMLLLSYIQYMTNSMHDDNEKVLFKKLLMHLDKCTDSFCACIMLRELLNHFHSCHDDACLICGPTRSSTSLPLNPGLDKSKNVLQKTYDDGDASQSTSGTFEDIQRPSKLLKREHPFSPLFGQNVTSQALASFADQHHSQSFQQMHQLHGMPVSVTEAMEVKIGMHMNLIVDHVNTSGTENGYLDDHKKLNLVGDLVISKESFTSSMQEDIKTMAKQEAEHELTVPVADNVEGTKLGKTEIEGVSLMEMFTLNQIKEHILSLRQWVGQSKTKAEKNQTMVHCVSENSCRLCAVEKLSFEPPPLYCSFCGGRIKRNLMYYTASDGIMPYTFCTSCYSESRGESITVDGYNIPKASLQKKKNDEVTEESWVQCDKCEGWQHQICALFNSERNKDEKAEYVCPYCFIQEMESGVRKPLADHAILGAKDLPRTMLSDHIEERLFKRLKQEREERAKVLGKNFDEVPGAENLIVRVVSSIEKILAVKQCFLDFFHEENYPVEFPYRSKVILLFQKIEGVDICLFGMCVQEFSSECYYPNQRCVYLAYLDSVKYFRPETKTVTGEALRTFVYHEILIGYLDYCKKRGFTSCYIWACPPLKGEDFILYFHPEIQKVPKTDKLREWYLMMLRKAAEENIVVSITNLYNHFFVPPGECKAKVTATRLPYFDGDFWPGAAEDILRNLDLEKGIGHLQRKGKKFVSRRVLKAMRQTDVSGSAAKDILLMKKLGETIFPIREDFIVVQLQLACTHCSDMIISGRQWICNLCKNFQLCDKKAYRGQMSLTLESWLLSAIQN
ncbi:PREDICTED: probable histone acetyltransferase HAC-like 1 [Nelumbo nucifera]|uniref:histone acetyltransferase n=1 Tax=Nelumbo nucifera TaxID=4432 RepID=A0A1U8AQX0_NELNU|nr:PREDICTED: probable histone acetyltransferase HAC-like 1 [Nelumbo nucifera]